MYLAWYGPNMNKLEERMKHFVIISKEQHEELRNCLPLQFRDKFPPGTALPSQLTHVLHHIDDASVFEDETKYPRVYHPSWTALGPATDGMPDWYREKPAEAHWKCLEQHTYATCLCHTGGLVHHGQDESVFGCKSLPSRVWFICGKTSMSPKSDGNGSMVSSYVSEELGFGANGRTPEELIAFNEWRKARATRLGNPVPVVLTTWPSEVFFDYGKDKGNNLYPYPRLISTPSHIIYCRRLLGKR